MANAEIIIAGRRGDVCVGGKPRKIVFIYGARPKPDEHCTARIENNILIATGNCRASIYDRVLTVNGSGGAAITNNILYIVGG